MVEFRTPVIFLFFLESLIPNSHQKQASRALIWVWVGYDAPTDGDPYDLSYQAVFNPGGFGYRTISSLPHRQSPRIRRLLAMFTKRSMPLELWLGRGKPLDPYLRRERRERKKDREGVYYLKEEESD